MCGRACTHTWRLTPASHAHHATPQVNGKVLEKRINVRVEHVLPSKCRTGHIARVKKNEEVKKAVRAGKMEKQNLKRQPILPREGYEVSYDVEPETIQPIPFSDVL